MNTEHEVIEFDVVFVGGGPASLAGAIRLMQLAADNNMELEVALIEKGAEIGSHAVSGAIVNPVALNALLPDHMAQGCPVETTVRGDEFYFLTADKAWRMPMVPRYLHNKGHYIVSLSRLSRWLGEQAEQMGINIFPGFAGTEVLFASDDRTVAGVRTGDKGLDKDGKAKANFEAGFDLQAKVTVFGEGARGSLFKAVADRLGLYEGKMPPVYETGIKEVIQLADDRRYFDTSDGNDMHFMGYPLGLTTPGGGFVYEMKDHRVAIGYLTALCYEDPLLDPYEMFLQFKHHPFVADLIKGGKVIEQGARTVSTGGYYTMPKLAADGAVFVGGCASIHNTPALKGVHVAMQSGMLAAEAIIEALGQNDVTADGLSGYARRFENDWSRNEIFEGRNFAQALAKKGPAKWIHLGAQYVTGGKGLVDPMKVHSDHATLSAAGDAPEPEPAAVDGELYVDKLTGVYLSRTMHREDQPGHLIIHDPRVCAEKCYPLYRSPCTRFCPGNVYELETDAAGKARIKLNPSNCFHCKTCDIKDPFGNITWTCPEGGEGPGYSMV